MKPLKPGWYWIFGATNLPQVVKVDDDQNVWFAGSNQLKPVSEFVPYCTFKGPLRRPRDDN